MFLMGPGGKPADVHDQCKAAGLPVEGVRWNGTRYVVNLSAGASKTERDQANAIATAVLAIPADTADPKNVSDALVTLQFEPQNAEALSVLRSRYVAISRK